MKKFPEFEPIVQKIESSGDVQLECKLAAQLRCFQGEIEAFLNFANQNQDFKADLIRLTHLLDRSVIASILSSSNGIEFLRNNMIILHNLRTFEDFTTERMSQLRASFDVERLGPGLNTFLCLC